MERDEIGSRVNKIVAQIEEWESSLEETGYKGVTVKEDVAPIESEEQVVQEFQSEGTGEEATLTEQNDIDEEKKVQHNLFSMRTSPYDNSSE